MDIGCESELCDLFGAAASQDGWDVYPEVSGWDLVLVQDDFQVGVEAKLRAGIAVLDQASSRMGERGAEPDARAVLVPHVGRSFERVATRLGLRVYTLRHCAEWKTKQGYTRSRIQIRKPQVVKVPRKRLWLPPVPLHRSGGGPNPTSMTPWRVEAIRLCAKLREEGRLTAADFRDRGVRLQTWVERGWLLRVDRGVYVAGGMPLPDVGFEAESKALIGGDKWD